MQQGVGIVAIEVFVCHQLIGDTVGHICAHLVLYLPLSEEVERLIDGYAEEPCRHLRLALKLVDVFPRLHECVLKDVVGILMS